MDLVLLGTGGADWEYIWRPATGPRQHVRRLLGLGAQRHSLDGFGALAE